MKISKILRCVAYTTVVATKLVDFIMFCKFIGFLAIITLNGRLVEMASVDPSS